MKTSYLIIPSVIFLTLPLACNATQMSELSCFKTSDPNITHVAQLYIEKIKDDDNLWNGTGPPPLCSSTPLPSPSECVVCSQQVVYAVCSNLPEKKTLVMEGRVRRIHIKKSECPNFLDEGSPNNTTPPNTTSSSPSKNLNYWWFLLLPLIIIFIAVAVYCYREKIPGIRNQRRRKPVPADDPEDVAEDVAED